MIRKWKKLRERMTPEYGYENYRIRMSEQYAIGKRDRFEWGAGGSNSRSRMKYRLCRPEIIHLW